MRPALTSGRITLHHTLRRIEDNSEITKTAGKIYLDIPAVLSVSTPGAVRTTGPHSTLPFSL